MITALRIVAFHLLLLHAFTAWCWLWLFHYIIQFKPALLGREEFETTVGLPMGLTYVLIGASLLWFVLLGWTLEQPKRSSDQSPSRPWDNI